MLHVRAFLNDKNVCSVLATTRYCVDRILRGIHFRAGQTILEYGPGDGALTRELLGRMSPDSRLIAIETNGIFVEELRARLPDPRLLVVHGAAEQVIRISKRLSVSAADYVISGIPFSMVTRRAKRRLIADTRSILSRGGTFFVYQSLTAPIARIETKRILSESFFISKERFLLPNLPPLYLLQAQPLAVR